MPYGGAHGDAVRYRARHDDYHLNPVTGAKDAAGRGHLEAATGRDVGMGGAYDVGPQRISWAQHMLTNWMGDHAFYIASTSMFANQTWLVTQRGGKAQSLPSANCHTSILSTS